MLYMTKQLLLLRLDHINDEIRQYAAGMKGMCEIPYNSPLVKMDSDAMSELYSRRNHILKEIEDVDTCIALEKQQRERAFKSEDERAEYYMRSYSITPKYKNDVLKWLAYADTHSFSPYEVLSHIIEKCIDEECENE